MQILLPIEQNGYLEGRSVAGFRLQRLEVLNWGTFDKRLWVLDLAGETGLLTGANGSGKSTLVDGILTLLVPNKKRNYNQASSMTGKKERDEKSYVQGAYGRTRVEESYVPKPKLLREKGTPSVLLAYFWDAVSGQKVTLAQVLWIEEGSVRKFFAIASDELNIASHFKFTHISDLKKRLKALDVEIFEEFIKYSQSFRKRFGLQSEKALDLFNQTVSIKEIGGLNDFVRNHMLEKTDVQTKIQELQESYENLTVSHNAILKARKQLEVLTPLMDEAEKYTRIKQEIEASQLSCKVAPAYFARQKYELLEEELQTIEQQLTQSQHRQAECDRLLADLDRQKDSLNIAISQDSIAQRLQELTRELQQCQNEVTRKKQKAKEYDHLAELLNMPQYSSSATFDSAKAQGDDLKGEIERVLQNLEQERDEQITQRQELSKEQEKLALELASLRQRQTQIPNENLKIRDHLVHNLNLNETDLPFIGELLQVRSDASEWQGAIERLLRSFGLCILVPEQYYRSVNAYVHNTHLSERLVYYRVTLSTPNPTQRALNPGKVPHKLEIKRDDEVFYQWIQERLIRHFSYACCDTMEHFQHESLAITRTGLIKHGGERHEKDDRSQIGDRRKYILGWNNADKIKALEADLDEVSQRLTQVKMQIESLERHRTQCVQQKASLQDFMNFIDFAEIDWRSTESARLKLLELKRELEASSDRLKQLELQLEQVQQQTVGANKQRDSLIREIQTLEDRQIKAKADRCLCESRFQPFSSQSIEAFAIQIAAKLRRYSMVLDTIDRDEVDVKDYFQAKLTQQQHQREGFLRTIAVCMVNFKNTFPETAVEMGTNLEALDEYIELKAQIEREDLPRYEQRFKELMTEKITSAIVMFKSSLEKQEKEIQQSIYELNQSLRLIKYTESTYIELRCEINRDRDIHDFRKDLIDCLGDVIKQSHEDNEKRFQNIQSRLIKPFKEQERWTNKVTDVRNWLDFSVSERYKLDNSEKEHHTDSSGKSGGQKVKLAYTILASAIAYQFGLNREDPTAKSFRFVVIDEAFSKSDDDNCRYAMELFKNLELQLLVITPKDKINTIEQYLSSLHFISNVPEGNYSSIASIAIEKYRQNRHISSKVND